MCSVDDCLKIACRAGQRCNTHYGKPCSTEGCTSKAQAKGVCVKHGAYGECLKSNCSSNAVKRGRLCFKHTVKLSCADPTCDTPQVLGYFVCIKHGAFGYCTTYACITNAITTRGKCRRHDSKTVACSAEGCDTNARARGLCCKLLVRGR